MRRWLKTRAVALITSEATLALRRKLYEIRRRLMAEVHVVTFYHRVDDPYSHLLAQVLPDLLERFEIRLDHRLVPAPAAEMAPEPALLAGFGLRDCAELGRYHELEFDPAWRLPPAALSARAAAILAAASDTAAFVALAPEVGRALWSGAAERLEALAAEHGAADGEVVARALADGAAELEKQGHYQGAMLHYGGEWYWGVDRLSWLEERLEELGLARRAEAWRALRLRPRALLPGDEFEAGAEVGLDFYLSFRSPYTFLAMARVLDLVERYPVRFTAKPVLPMLMRGLPVPRAKQLYILGDAAREARRLGLPFGNFADPLGPGVERCMAIFPHAERQGRVVEYLRATFEGIWIEALDAASDDGLATMVERAGLDWEEARAHLGDESWRQMAERNQRDLAAQGLWGVPSFALGRYAAWGQDRLWIVEQKLKAHFG
jgi:2-hydroxychromene-2-carboxylate isomerase